MVPNASDSEVFGSTVETTAEFTAESTNEFNSESIVESRTVPTTESLRSLRVPHQTSSGVVANRAGRSDRARFDSCDS